MSGVDRGERGVRVVQGTRDGGVRRNERGVVRRVWVEKKG